MEITKANMNDRDIDLEYVVKKTCGLPNEPAGDDKVTLAVTIVWKGRKMARMLKNSSEVEATNWYNNHRPSDGKDSNGKRLQTPEEMKRRIDYLRSLVGKPVIVEAEDTAVKEAAEPTVDQLTEILTTGNEPQRIWAAGKLAVYKINGSKADVALATFEKQQIAKSKTK